MNRNGSNLAAANKVAEFYDQRVWNEEDLNTRLARANRSRSVHHHSGLVDPRAIPPAADREALAWLYEREQDLVDKVWQVAHQTAPRRPIRILDMGCGEGGTLARFAELAPDSRHLLELVGITLSEQQSAAAKSALPSATWLVGDMLHPLYLPPKWFHLIIAVESTEYVSEAHLPDFMYQAASLLASQGLLIIVAGSWSSHMPAADPFPHQLDSHYHTHISRSWFYPQAAREAGLLSVAEIDLAPLTVRYWQIRRDRVALRNSTGGWVENGLYQALKEGRAEYKLYVWRCP